jgi:hypothetical protein
MRGEQAARMRVPRQASTLGPHGEGERYAQGGGTTMRAVWSRARAECRGRQQARDDPWDSRTSGIWVDSVRLQRLTAQSGRSRIRERRATPRR